MRKWITLTPGLMSLLPLSGITLPFKGIGQTVIFSGVIVDAYTKKSIDGVSVYYFPDGRRKLLAGSGPSGSFEFSIQASVSELLLSKAGFRDLLLHVNHGQPGTGGERYYFELPLIPLDSQVRDNPYQQSEQKDFVLEKKDSGAAAKKTGVKSVTRTFLLKDAVYGHAVKKARLCLTYTQSGNTECFEFTPDSSSRTREFYETDIVAFQVESAGYQPYKGNLILNEIDGSSKDYVIRLTPELTLIAATVAPGDALLKYVLATSQGTSLPMRAAAPNHSYAIVPPGIYEWQAVTPGGQIIRAEKIQVRNGLTYKTFTPAPQSRDIRRPALSNTGTRNPAQMPASPAAAPITAGPVPELPAELTIYFEQGEYRLQPEASETLNRVAAWLLGNPKGRIILRGHTDNVGIASRNRVLSEYRCRRTSNYLMQKGVRENQIKWFAEGGEHPAKPNDSESNKKWNRRVEIELIP